MEGLESASKDEKKCRNLGSKGPQLMAFMMARLAGATYSVYSSVSKKLFRPSTQFLQNITLDKIRSVILVILSRKAHRRQPRLGEVYVVNMLFTRNRSSVFRNSRNSS